MGAERAWTHFDPMKSKSKGPFAVAGWLAEPDGSLSRFRWRLWSALSLVGLGLLAMMLLQVRFGLAPLRQVERSP